MFTFNNGCDIYISMNNNQPAGYIEDRDHLLECKEQPEGFPCICDHLADEKFQESINIEANDE